MLRLDQPTITDDERELLNELRRLYDRYERLNHKIAFSHHRQKFSRDPGDVEQATHDEQKFLGKINDLMDRLGVIEGHLMRVRKKVRPVLN
jgi:RecA-family ATPase